MSHDESIRTRFRLSQGPLEYSGCTLLVAAAAGLLGWLASMTSWLAWLGPFGWFLAGLLGWVALGGARFANAYLTSRASSYQRRADSPVVTSRPTQVEPALSARDAEIKEAIRTVFLSHAERASNAAKEVLDRVLDRILPLLGSLGEAGELAASLIRRHLIDNELPERMVTNALDHANSPGYDDVDKLQGYIADHFANYTEIAARIHSVGKTVSFQFLEDENYKRWRTLDADYLEAFRKLAVRSDMSRIAQSISVATLDRRQEERLELWPNLRS
jgi:hypothetical protein